MFFTLLRLLTKSWNIRRRGLRWVIKNHSCQPGTTSNWLSSLRPGSHGHHRCIRDKSAHPPIFHRHAVEIKNTHLPTSFLSGIPQLPIRLFQMTRTISKTRINKFGHWKIFNEDGLKEQQRLHHHVHTIAISQKVELGKFLGIRNRRNDSIQLQPLSRKAIAKAF